MTNVDLKFGKFENGQIPVLLEQDNKPMEPKSMVITEGRILRINFEIRDDNGRAIPPSLILAGLRALERIEQKEIITWVATLVEA